MEMKYATERTRFEANPTRLEGAYSKFASLDDKAQTVSIFLWRI